MSKFRFALFLLTLSAFFLFEKGALADSNLLVSVGYADNTHCPQYNVSPALCVENPPATFPNPWKGSAGLANFIGEGVEGVGFDAGAILLQNTGASSISVNDVKVTIGTNIFDLWGSFSVPAGQYVILTQTSFDPTTLAPNFDTSDTSSQCCVNDGIIPTVAITIGSTVTTLSDTNQILNTDGSDLGCKTSDCVSTNESHSWSLIPGQTVPTPEPSSFILLTTGLVGLGTRLRRKNQ